MDILENWGISGKKREDIKFYGSPERSFKREAYEDNNNLFVLESVFNPDKREKIAIILEKLHKQGVNVNPYIRTKNNELVVRGLRDYQLSKYIFGEELKRPDYVNESWRGKVLAQFLIKLRKAKIETDLEGVNLHDYIKDMAKKLKMTKYYNFIKPVFTLPKDFCHGDFHPLNIIWGDEITVIDWEFCGLNIRSYDAANLLGCLGIEHPEHLFSPLAKAFIKELKEYGFFSEKELNYLPELILATRFGWLREWLKDKEMYEMELEYMKILKENCEDIKTGLK